MNWQRKGHLVQSNKYHVCGLERGPRIRRYLRTIHRAGDLTVVEQRVRRWGTLTYIIYSYECRSLELCSLVNIYSYY